MWALTSLTLIVAVGAIRSGDPVEGASIGFLGVLLIAFPAIRNSVPNAPPLGVLGDFASYFWCEITIGVTLVTLLTVQILRTRAAARTPQNI